MVAIYGAVTGLVTLFFGVRVLWRTSRTLLTWSVVWAAVIVALGVLQILGLLQLGSRTFGDIVILATIAIGAAGLQSFVARQDMPATSQSAKDSAPPSPVAPAPVAPAVSPPPAPSGLTYTPPPGRPFTPPPPAPIATVVGGHVILAPPEQPVLVPGEDRTSPVLVVLALLTGLLALTIVGYAVLARDGGLLAGAAPTRTPVVAPTPARSMRLVTPPPFIDTVPLTFGVEYDPESFVIADPADKFRVAVKEIAWNASLRQPAGVTSLTFRFARRSKTGAEEVLLSKSIPLSDEAAMTVAATEDLSKAASNQPGTYVVRLLRGAVVLAEGTLTLVK